MEADEIYNVHDNEDQIVNKRKRRKKKYPTNEYISKKRRNFIRKIKKQRKNPECSMKYLRKQLLQDKYCCSSKIQNRSQHIGRKVHCLWGKVGKKCKIHE